MRGLAECGARAGTLSGSRRLSAMFILAPGEDNIFVSFRQQSNTPGAALSIGIGSWPFRNLLILTAALRSTLAVYRHPEMLFVAAMFLCQERLDHRHERHHVLLEFRGFGAQIRATHRRRTVPGYPWQSEHAASPRRVGVPWGHLRHSTRLAIPATQTRHCWGCPYEQTAQGMIPWRRSMPVVLDGWLL